MKNYIVSVKKCLVMLALTVVTAGVTFAAEPPPYTFGMTVVAPVMKTPLMYVTGPAGATGNLLTISTGATDVFRVTGAGAVHANSIVATSLSGSVPASSVLAGSLGSGVIASSIAVNAVQDESIVGVSGSKVSGDIAGNAANITGNLAAAQIAAGTLPSNVMASSVALSGFYSDAAVRSALGLGIGADVQAWSTNLDTLAGNDGSSLTSLNGAQVGAGVAAANIAAGSLGSSVIASSIAVNAVHEAAIAADAVVEAKIANSAVTDAKIAAVSASKLSGVIPQAVQVFSDADCEVLTPAAQGQLCYDTTLFKLNVSTSTDPGGYEALH